MYPLEATIVRLQDTIDLNVVYGYVRLYVCVYARNTKHTDLFCFEINQNLKKIV